MNMFIKFIISIITADNGETIFIRDCALDSGTLTTDTELVRTSHCGGFVFEDRYATGCVQACNVDACNESSRECQVNLHLLFLSLILATKESQLKVLFFFLLTITLCLEKGKRERLHFHHPDNK